MYFLLGLLTVTVTPQKSFEGGYWFKKAFGRHPDLLTGLLNALLPLRMGIPVAQVMQATGLTEEQVNPVK